MDTDVYSLNPRELPRSPVTPEEHRRFLNMAVIITGFAILLGLLFWWFAISRQPEVNSVASEADIRSQIATVLRNASVQQVSAEEVNRIATQLRKSETTVTAQERSDIANVLRGVNQPASN